jgi:hypothetical protein
MRPLAADGRAGHQSVRRLGLREGCGPIHPAMLAGLASVLASSASRPQPTAVSQIVTGNRALSLQQVVKLARAPHVPLDEILGTLPPIGVAVGQEDSVRSQPLNRRVLFAGCEVPGEIIPQRSTRSAPARASRRQARRPAACALLLGIRLPEPGGMQSGADRSRPKRRASRTTRPRNRRLPRGSAPRPP